MASASSPELGDLEFGPESGGDPSRSLERVRGALLTMRRVAVWGASDNQARKCYRVIRFLAEQYLEVIPLGDAPVIAGLPAARAVDWVDPPPDVVAVFCSPPEVAEVAEVLAVSRIPAVWFQEGLLDPEAARRLERAGKLVVMDRCVMRAYRRDVLGEGLESWFPV